MPTGRLSTGLLLTSSRLQETDPPDGEGWDRICDLDGYPQTFVGVTPKD